MGRSQRHTIIEQGSDATGASIGQGVIAPGLLAQAGEGEVTYGAELQGIENIEVPVGPPGGPLSGSTLTGAIPAAIDDGPGPGPGPEPEPGREPTLDSLDPNTVAKDAPNITMRCLGTNFTPTSVIVFAGVDEPTTFVSDTELTTGVTPSLGWGTNVGIPVHIRQGTYETAPIDFTFTDAEPEALASDRDAGPFNIVRIEDHMEGLAVTLDGGEFKAGDDVMLEAVGNSNINGAYEILEVEGLVVVIDSNFELLSPIENKGRLTITGAVA